MPLFAAAALLLPVSVGSAAAPAPAGSADKASTGKRSTGRDGSAKPALDSFRGAVRAMSAP